MNKINLGCGIRKIYGFINVDINKEYEPDICIDIKNIDSLRYLNIKLIYASHVIEHFSRNEIESILLNWYKNMSNNSIIRLCVPDFEKVVEYYKETKNLNILKGFLYGGQKNSHDYHYNCWDFNDIKNLLEKVGFKNVHIYDWKKTEHFYVDDYSQSYLPHFDKGSGKLMSLNVEAVKE